MADTTISPNMNLPVPVPSTAPGPDWADDIVADMYAIDSHDHSDGKGVPITPDGLNISADLPMNDNNLTEARSVNFTSQVSPIALPADVGCIYVSGADLYYNDTAANQVRITQSGSVTGATGTITGLPSGTASASYSAGTFTFQSATNTPANMAVGPLTIGRNSAASKTVSLTPNVAQASNFDMTLPLALPSATSALTVDNAGGMAFSIITAASFSPTITYTNLGGPTLTFTTNSTDCAYIRVGSTVFVSCTFNYTVSGWVSSTSTYTITLSIPIATASLSLSGGMAFFGGLQFGNTIYLSPNGSNNGVFNANGNTYNTNFTYANVYTYSYQIS